MKQRRQTELPGSSVTRRRRDRFPEVGPVAELEFGEQLELPLRMPWHGRAPRYLTRGFSLRSFGGTGRANLEGATAQDHQPERREDLQLWLFQDDEVGS